MAVTTATSASYPYPRSLTSVVNNPSRKIESLGEFWEKFRESVEEREAEAKVVAEAAASEALLGQLPKVADFQAYLDTFADVWEIYARNHKTKLKMVGAASGGIVNDIADNDAAGEAHRTVPPEYFQSDFRLEHHQLFRQSLQSSVEGQEELNAELTGHLDTIEVALLEHIRRAQRDQLFETLATLGDPLQEDLKSTLGVVRSLRGRLHSVQQKQLRDRMAVGRLARRKCRITEVLQRLDVLAHVQQSQPSIEILLEGQDFVTALELLESTKAALDSDLKGLASVRPGTSRLSELGSTFDRGVEADFVHNSTEAILCIRRLPIDQELPEVCDVADQPAGASLGGSSIERLKRLCWCLARRERLTATLSSTLRDVLLSHLKKELRSHSQVLLEELSQEVKLRKAKSTPSLGGLEESSEAEGAKWGPAEEPAAEGSAAAPPAPTGAGAGISASLRSLPFESFLVFWRHMLQSGVDVANRFFEYAVLVQGTVQQGLGGSGEVAEARSSKEDIEVSSELLRLYEVIINSLLQKIGVFLQARQGEHQQLKVKEWQALLTFTGCTLDRVKGTYDRCRQRLTGSEELALVGDIGGSLRPILYTQTKVIIDEQHQQRLAQVNEVLEQEKWEKTKVPLPYKQLLDQLLGVPPQPVQDGSTSPSALAAPSHEPSSNSISAEAGGSAAGEIPVDWHLRVDEHNFLVVPAVLTLIQLLADYVQLCRDLDFQAAEIVQRMISLLRLFNQQSQKLVLLGGLTKKKDAARKTITAPMLALCSQCCGLVAKMLPKLQQHMLEIFQAPSAGPVSALPSARHVGAALLEEFTKLAAEYDEHCNLLFGKLSEILLHRCLHHAKEWFNTPHHELPPESPPFGEGGDCELSPHEAMEGLVKEITQMYKALFRNLTGGDRVKKIFAKAFAEVSVKFEQQLSQKPNAPSPPYERQVGRSLGDRLAMDLAYLQEHLGKLSVIAGPVHSLLSDLVRHVQAKLPAEDGELAVHPTVLEILQRVKGLPQ